MASVYIVTQGTYSDYHIVGVFITQEHAQALVDLYPATLEREKMDIEEWPLEDTPPTPVGMAAYSVSMEATGAASRVERSVNQIWAAQNAHTLVYNNGRERVPWMVTHMFARDDEHAIKIANERRAYLIATEQWTDGDHTEAFTQPS